MKWRVLFAIALACLLIGCGETVVRNIISPELLDEVEDETEVCLDRECCIEKCGDAKAKWHPVRLECECMEGEE